jgi:hypothetical protein
MSWKWAVAGAMALGMGAAGAAQAATFDLTVNITSASLVNGAAVPAFTPFTFHQIWRTGAFTSGAAATTLIETGIDDQPDYDQREVDGGGGASVDPTGFTGQILSLIGLADPGVGSYGVSESQIFAPGPAGIFGGADVGVNTNVFTQDGREHSFAIGAELGFAIPSVPNSLVEDDFDNGFTSGPGAYGMRVSDCGPGPCTGESDTFVEYEGTFTATEVAGVPEPTAWALMLIGFAGLGATLRRRREASAV